jgi:hypothetical protein
MALKACHRGWGGTKGKNGTQTAGGKGDKNVFKEEKR